MGRGRQKAKQTKVARELKYFSPNTDYDALAKELHGSSATSTDGFGDDLGDDEDGSVVDDDADDAAAANGWREAGR